MRNTLPLSFPLLLLSFCLLGGCASYPETPEELQQQNEADLVVGFQSWNSIAFIKPDVTGSAGAMTTRQKTFRREGFVKLLKNLKLHRNFAVVILDRHYQPDPALTRGGTADIENFFKELGFNRIAFQDALKKGSFNRRDRPAADS